MPLKNFLFTVIIVGGFFALAEILLAVDGVRPALSTDDPFFGFAGNVPLYVEVQADDGSTVLRPDDYIVRARLAELLERQGEDGPAMEQYRKVLQDGPDLARAHLRLAGLLIRREEAAEALQHGQEALRLDPALYEAHYVIGLAMQQQVRLDEAEHHFSEAQRHETNGNVDFRQRQDLF